MSHMTYADEIHALETILGRVRQEKAAAEAERDGLGRMVHDKAVALQRAEEDRDALSAHVKMQSSVVVRLYNCGYHAGHHDTVEGQYTDVHRDDMDSYHAEEVDELLSDLGLSITPATSILARLKAEWQAEALEAAAEDNWSSTDMYLYAAQLRRQAEEAS